MATTRDTVELLIEILGQDGLERLAQATEKASESAKKAARSYEVLDTVVNKSVGVVGTYEIATDKVNHELDEMVAKSMEATHAQMAMGTLLEETTARTTALAGKGGSGGYGLMGASYAAQDFVTVLSGGGGLGRALSSAANNITPMLLGLGVGSGLAGVLGTVVTVASAGTMAVEGFWKAANSEHADEARQKYQDLTNDLKKANAEFAKLTGAPSEAEKLSAEGFKLFMEGKGNAERVRNAIAPGLPNNEAMGGMGEADRKTFADAEAAATMSDEQVLARAQQSIGESINPLDLENAIKDVSKDRETAQRTRARLLRQARQQAATSIVSGSTQEGPAGNAARKRLRDLSMFLPGKDATELGGYTPEAIEAAEKEHEADEGPGSEAFGRRAHDAGVARRKAAREKREEVEAEATPHIDELDRSNAEHARAKSSAKAKATHDAARAKREAAQAKREAREEAAAAKKAPEIERGHTADALLAHGPEIVGQAFGPDAAAMASQANPAEVQAIRERTIKNLADAQPPYTALLNAFREIADESQRNAEQTRRFYGQITGMTQRLHRGTEQTPAPSGLER